MRGIKEKIQHQSAELKEEVTGLRRHFHKFPELSYMEVNTAAFISDWLEKKSIPFRKGIAGTFRTFDEKWRKEAFDLDEDGLVTGVANLSWLVYNFLISNKI